MDRGAHRARLSVRMSVDSSRNICCDTFCERRGFAIATTPMAAPGKRVRRRFRAGTEAASTQTLYASTQALKQRSSTRTCTLRSRCAAPLRKLAAHGKAARAC